MDEKKSFDIIFLQEIHYKLSKENNSKWSNSWNGQIFLSGESSNSCGVGILIANDINIKIVEYKNCVIGRLQILKCEINETKIALVNVYAPNQNLDKFLKTFEQEVQELGDYSLIVGGDFNVVMDFEMDKLNGGNDTNKISSIKLNQLTETYDLIDIYRNKYPQKKEYTWHSNSSPPIFCRLDYFFVSTSLENNVTDCKILPGYKTDHSAVALNINLIKLNRGPGYFKINNSFLLDSSYQSKIKNAIKELVEFNSESNPNIKWELIKGRIRDESIKFATYKKKESRKEETEINDEIKNIEQKIIQEPLNQELISSLQAAKTKLDKLNEYKLKGMIIRTKAIWIEGSEKNTKFFANLERTRSEEKIIKQIRIENKLESNPKKVLSYIQQFYKKLYTKDNDLNELTDSEFDTNHIPKLSDEDRTKFQPVLTENECFEALKNMKNDKSPGSDGITAEFYKIFWPEVKGYLIESLNYSYQTNGLTELQKQSIITLLPKKDKDVLSINNWRPVSLLNVDYKIASKTIANRIKTYLDKLISFDQTGFIKGRYIGENIRTIQEIIEHVKSNNTAGLILFTDFQKAFDSISHTYMYSCLSKMGFDISIINWVKLFYNDAKSCISNNGFFSEFFQINRGVRQGCPLSPYIFIICLEFLTNNIANNPDIKGIKIKNIEFKQTLFADDASFFTENNQ